MRDKFVLLEDFENMKILCQYLYMSENHKIVVHNAIKVPLEIRMRDDLHIECRNLNFPDIPAMHYDSEFNPFTMCNIVEVLKEEPAVELPNAFKNRWDEIKALTTTQVSLNKMQASLNKG